MSGQNIIQAMAEYHVASNRRLWQHCRQHLTDEQFIQPLGYSLGSLRQQVVHLAQTDRYWLHDIQTKPVTGLTAEDYPTMASFTAVWDGIEQALLDYVYSLAEPALAKVPDGLLERRWEALVHVFTHGTDHRAQILSMLHGLGAPTFEQDFGDHRRRRRRVSKTAVLSLILFRHAEWERLTAILAEDQWEQVTLGEWSVKDSLAHLTQYDRAMVDTVRARRLERGQWADLPPDERNRRIYDQHRGRPLADLLQENKNTHRALIEAIEALDDDDLNDPSRMEGLPADTSLWMVLERNTWSHYLAHTETLWARLGLTGQTSPTAPG